MLFSASEGPRLLEAGALPRASCTCSLWSGYLEEPSGQRLTAFLNDNRIPLVELHTSGHASITDLRRLAEALAPNRVVPIHTLGGESYDALYDVVDVQPDGAWWDV